MSTDNAIARSGGEGASAAQPAMFEMPPELAARYELRVIDGPGDEQRVGLFRSNDRDNPSIEISDDRIVARSEDAETVAALVKIARHSGWERMSVDGSPDFRKAVWEAATREGLSITGYEPSFAEQARVVETRADRRTRESREQAPPADRADVATGSAAAAIVVRPPDRGARNQPGGEEGQALSEGDRRLLLTLSRHSEDREALYENLRPEMDTFDREVQFERIDANREALSAALERAIESPTLAKAFERSGYTPDDLRGPGRGGDWDGEVADAIYLTRSGLHRDTLARQAETLSIAADEVEADREDREVAASLRPSRKQSPERVPDPDNPERRGAAERTRDSEDLAELFLHGGADRVAAEPRLAEAMQAQVTMERHIGEVFGGDVDSQASAALESRHMISDALRRGLDVAVREPAPVRQIEPAYARPDLER